MAKTIKSLLRISMAIRNLGTLSDYTMTRRFIRISTHCANNCNKETLVSPRPYLLSDNGQELRNSTSLQEAIKNCTSQTQVLRIIQTNQSKMTISDAIFALKALGKVEKAHLPRNSKIYDKPEFLALCEIIKKNVRHIEVGDLISILKVLTHFEVPTTSIIVQMILQVLRHSVNHLTLKQISFLEFLLQKCTKTPLVEALLIALPIIYENNVVTKLDRENILPIRNALSYMVLKSRDTELFNVILHALNNCKEPMDPLVAKSILWSLCELRCTPDELPQALINVQNIMAANITCVEKWSIMKLVKMIAEKMRAKEIHFYHEGFIDACASTVISEDWGFDDAISMLERLLTIGHTQIPLLDYIAGKCFEDRTLLETCPPVSIAVLINGFSMADYKPIFWDAVQDAIMSDRIIEAKTIMYPLSKLASCLLSLDCYCPKLLVKVFGNAVENMAYIPNKEKRRILSIYQAVKTLFPEYSGPLPDNDFVEELRPGTSKERHFFPLINALECALGGRSYVLTNIRSKLGHFIDHAVIMRKGGFPIAINSETITEIDQHPLIAMEDLKSPPDSQVILIVCVPPYAYSINTQRMKGNWSMHLKSLEALSGHTVIPIRRTMWTSLSESEKIPYLMQAIRLKCDEVSISANS